MPSASTPALAAFSAASIVSSYLADSSTTCPSTAVVFVSATFGGDHFSDPGRATVWRSSTSVLSASPVHFRSRGAGVSTRLFFAGTVDGSMLDDASPARLLSVAKHQPDSARRGFAATTAKLRMVKNQSDELRSALILLHASFWESHLSLLALVSRLDAMTSQFPFSNYLEDAST